MDGYFRVKILDYLKKILYDFPDSIQGIVVTQAEKNLFTVREYTNRKLWDKFEPLHSITKSHNSYYPLPVLGNISRQLWKFLTTRAGRPDEEDCRKIQQVIQHIISTIHTPLI